jgi:Fe2+ transport system protein B
MSEGMKRLGEILVLIYMILGFSYMFWWGYMLIARPDWVEKWRSERPGWVRRLMLVKKLPRSVEVGFGVVLMSFSFIFILFVCFLLVRSLLENQG